MSAIDSIYPQNNIATILEVDAEQIPQKINDSSPNDDMIEKNIFFSLSQFMTWTIE